MSLPILSDAAEVSVSVQPKSFPANQGGQLSVTVTGGNFKSPPNPTPPNGVNLRQYGQSQNIQIINGQMSRTITQNFVVSAPEPGDYTIPSFQVEVGNETLDTEPVTFTVTAASASPGSSNLPPAAGGGGVATADATESFLKLEYPPRDRDYLYVGEMAPVRITAYFPAENRVTLQSAPRPEGQGFTLHNLSEQPEQDFAVVDGVNYRTVTWFGGVSTAKAGKYPIQVALDATVMVRDTSQGGRSRPRSPFGNSPFGRSLFDDPFFDDFFDSAFTRMIPREVTLSSNDDPLDVRSLPTEGRPADFSGAVGEFSLGSYKLPADATTGEPRQIRVTVEGRGNFDRTGAPKLLPENIWKTYSPKTEFTPADSTAFSGRKTFEFSAVPQKGGEHEAQLSFSYFDPTKGSYETVTSPAIPLMVTGEDVNAQNAAAVAANAPVQPSEAKNDSEIEKETTDLAPSRVVGSAGSPAVIALFYETLFWLVVGLAVFAILVGMIARSVRRRLSDPVRVAHRETAAAENDALAAARAAAQAGDAPAFFAAARRSLQTRLAVGWNRPATSITLSELRLRLPSDSPAIKIFAAADALEYAPANANRDFDSGYWMKTLEQAMDAVASGRNVETMAAV